MDLNGKIKPMMYVGTHCECHVCNVVTTWTVLRYSGGVSFIGKS